MRHKLKTTAQNALRKGPVLDFPPFERLYGNETSDFIIVCDHASNAIPECYHNLGIDAEQMKRHIAYDIGVAEVTRHLNDILNVPAILSCFSRLLIDPNRGCDDPTLIMKISDGALISGNIFIDDAERAYRIKTFYEPYHEAIDAAIEETLAVGKTPALVSIHSFTRTWKGQDRPWHITFLWDQDTRLAKPMFDAFAQQDNTIVGENVPYKGSLHGDCMHRHGTLRGLPHALIEIRQDLIATPEGQREWAERIAGVLEGLSPEQFYS
ncbi:MAG: N-formylglutamate amidohydrolase [Pseudomonadota bacterium]